METVYSLVELQGCRSKLAEAVRRGRFASGPITIPGPLVYIEVWKLASAAAAGQEDGVSALGGHD